MGWLFGKSVNFGPVRMNLSKSGIGASFGVKGTRVSVGPRGTHVSLGRNGAYYRQRIGGPNNVNIRSEQIERVKEITNEILSASVDDLIDSSSDTLLKEINKKYQIPEYSTWAKVGLGLLFLVWPLEHPYH